MITQQTIQFELCLKDYITTMYPAWGQFLLPEKILALKCPEVSGSVVSCCRLGGTACSSACMGPFEGGHHYLHYLHHSLASGQITGNPLQYSCLENPRDGGACWVPSMGSHRVGHDWCDLAAVAAAAANNRAGTQPNLFKKIRDTKGTFHAKMCSIKDRNGMDLTDAEDIKKRWQEYT